MKRTLFFMTAALAAMLSSCENIEPQVSAGQDAAPEAEVLFTADLGADTKTYLEYQDGVYKVRWTEGDHFTIYDADNMAYAEDVDIISGAGTSSGTFAGSLQADTYLAYYGYRVNLEGGGMYPVISQYQAYRIDFDPESGYYYYGDSFADYEFPMAAMSDDTNFSFKNVASILKVSLTGDAYIRNIVITPNDPTVAISGAADLVIEGGRPKMVMHGVDEAANFIQYDIETTIDPSIPFECYVVVPSQTYTGGLTVKINSSNGYMDVSTSADIVMEQSQIRAIPTIVYEQEYTCEWGLCGEMTDNWSTDVGMTAVGDLWVLEDYWLDAGAEFKFRANGAWDINFGGYTEGLVTPNVAYPVCQGGCNMYVEQAGYYDLYLDVENQVAYIMEDGLLPGTYVECEDYDSLAALDDGTYVKLYGYVMATYGRGFILNVGQYYGNCVLVYQGTDLSAYYPVLGNIVEVYATKTTYRNLPEVMSVQRVDIYNPEKVDWGYGSGYDLTDPADFLNFSSDRYEYVMYKGVLTQSGNYYNVNVDGVTDRIGSLEYPDIDLTEYLDKEVYVEGYFIGFSSNGKFLSTIIKKISLLDTEGSTEDVNPGDDIPVTKTASLKTR